MNDRPEDPAERRCDHCGAELPLSRLFYRVAIELVSGFDGQLPEAPSEQDLHAALRRAADDERTAAELEHEVYQRLELLLCLRCRTELAEQLLLFGSAGESRRPAGALTQ